MPLIFGKDNKRDYVIKRGKSGQARRYAALPGTGPQGETCKSCKFCTSQSQVNTWYKCELMRSVWTGGRATDILVKSPACKRWEAK